MALICLVTAVSVEPNPVPGILSAYVPSSLTLPMISDFWHNAWDITCAKMLVKWIKEWMNMPTWIKLNQLHWLHIFTCYLEKESWELIPVITVLFTGSVVKNPPANTGDLGSIFALGGAPGEGNGNPLQYSCLRNPMDRGAWWAAVHGLAKESDTV